MRTIYTVYVHTNKTNGKKYVGQTSVEPKVRWKKGHGYSELLPIGRAFRKYGWDGFTHEIIASGLSEDEAKALEVELIAAFKTQDPTYGYNICAGGSGVVGWHHSEETKRMLSEKKKGLFGGANSNYGHKWTNEMRAAASARQKNMSSETRQKISAAAKNRVGEANPFFGKHHNDATKAVLSKLRSRPVDMLSEDMDLLRTYPSIKIAAEDTGINKVGISNCCRGITKTSGGYIWQYSEK